MDGKVAAKNVFMFYRCYVFKMSPWSLDDGWTYRNADCCVNITDLIIAIVQIGLTVVQ